MELVLFVALVAVAGLVALKLAVFGVKLLVGLVLLPFKLLGALAGVLLAILLFPVGLAVLLAFLGVGAAVLALALPLAIPLALLCGLVWLVGACC